MMSQAVAFPAECPMLTSVETIVRNFELELNLSSTFEVVISVLLVEVEMGIICSV